MEKKSKILQDLTYFVVGINKEIVDTQKLIGTCITKKDRITASVCIGRLQVLKMARSGINNIIKKEHKRQDRIEKFGEKKVGRPKKLAQKIVNKYGYI
jgi:hypothetical protein